MNLSFLLPKVRRDFVAAEARAARGDWFGTTKDTNFHEKLTTEDTEGTEGEAGLRPGSRAGASESDSLASELADSPVSESLNRSAIGPAEAAKPPRTDPGGIKMQDSTGREC
jgi:hypothetical protein